MSTRFRTMVAMPAAVLLPAATILVLHDLGDRPWFRIDYRDFLEWLERTSLADAVTAFMRLAALAFAYYLLVSTVLYLSAVASGNPMLVRTVRPYVIPMVRSMADRVIAGSLVVGVIASPLIASSPPYERAAAASPVSTEVFSDPHPGSSVVDAEVVPPPAAPAPDDDVAFDGRPTTPPRPAPRPSEQDVRAGELEVRVVAGDHLWGLAESRVAEALGRTPMDHEVAPYWRAVVDENRSRIRSGNPDLIHPGEIVVLPDPDPHLTGR